MWDALLSFYLLKKQLKFRIVKVSLYVINIPKDSINNVNVTSTTRFIYSH